MTDIKTSISKAKTMVNKYNSYITIVFLFVVGCLYYIYQMLYNVLMIYIFAINARNDYLTVG